MGTRDLPDMYALSPWALGIHIRQITLSMLQLSNIYTPDTHTHAHIYTHAHTHTHTRTPPGT